MSYSDSHAHLVDYQPEQLEKILQLMQVKHVDFALSVGVDLDSSESSIHLAESYKNIIAAVGIHPWFAVKIDDEMRKRFERFAGSKYVKAIGEIGLDYAPPGSPDAGEPPQGMPKMDFPDNMPPLPETPAPPEIQKELFSFELSIALKYGLPVNVHCLGGAHQDMMTILGEEVRSGLKGIAHSFEGNLNMLRDWLDIGFYIAFGTKQVIDEPLAGLEEIIHATPLERLVVETDANPMHSPDGPVDVIPVVQKIAEIRGTVAEEIGEATTANLSRVLKL